MGKICIVQYFFMTIFLIAFHFIHVWDKGPMHNSQTANLAVASPSFCFFHKLHIIGL